MSEIDFYNRLNRLEKRRKGTDLTYNAFDSDVVPLIRPLNSVL